MPGNTKVAIIIPTMNRPDFVLRQLRFYELQNSPHPVYLSDSSDEENATKLKEGIKKFKNLEVTYQWAPPGKDSLHKLLPLVKEKYCIQMGDDDIMIPETVSACADFLENHPDYTTCGGKQINFRFRSEDYDKPYGVIERQTRPLGRSIEDEDLLVRTKNFWSNTFFIVFSVRRVDLEKEIRNTTKHFLLMERMLEFLLVSNLISSGKSKNLDKLGHIMQVSDLRYKFDYNMAVDFLTAKSFYENWKIAEKSFSEIFNNRGMSQEESIKTVRALFALDYAHQLSLDSAETSVANTDKGLKNHGVLKKIRKSFSENRIIKNIYHKYHPPEDITDPASKYYSAFKIVKNYLEQSTA